MILPTRSMLCASDHDGLILYRRLTSIGRYQWGMTDRLRYSIWMETLGEL